MVDTKIYFCCKFLQKYEDSYSSDRQWMLLTSLGMQGIKKYIYYVLWTSPVIVF